MPLNRAVALSKNGLCGLCGWHPTWMQRLATTKMFMAVYGLLGTIQAMSYMYFIVTLTTIEKRFKIPSQTTGIVLSGNEVSQILLSLILSYIGGQRDRPRWIAWGVVFCGLSCYIIALPHFIYGAGDELLQLTEEYIDSLNETKSSSSLLFNVSLVNTTTWRQSQSQPLCGKIGDGDECGQLLSLAPLILIFLSQFVLGIGNTMYYSLGQTYLDDNTKKTNTPLMLAIAMSLRMFGPIVGFFLGYFSLNLFIDVTKTPVIDRKDPRWLGAWWFGWIILGTAMLLFSGLVGLFPKQLPKRKRQTTHNTDYNLPFAISEIDGNLPLDRNFSSNTNLQRSYQPSDASFPILKNFPTALMRLLRNKLLIFNTLSGVFYILGSTGYVTFLSKYMEVMFHKTSQDATIIVGPLSIAGMITGLLGSGLFISKLKPTASKVLMWNVIVGFVFVMGQISYIFLYCGDSTSLISNGKLNLTTPCNRNCSCESVPYAPICYAATETTYFSPCHAGCNNWNSDNKTYTDCSCFINSVTYSNTSTSESSMISVTESLTESYSDRLLDNLLYPGPCLRGCTLAFWGFSILSMIINWFGSSGRVGNILVNYRCVLTEDKSFAQGLTLMLISLFALIPGPIIYGAIIDSTCMVWTKTCNGNGNCQLYDQTKFRYFVNATAILLTSVGVFFDILVWYYGKQLDLYGDERRIKRREEIRRRNQPITPLLARK